MVTIRHARQDCSPGCSVKAAISLIDGEWKSIVLSHHVAGTERFNEVRHCLGDAYTPRMLTNRLREI